MGKVRGGSEHENSANRAAVGVCGDGDGALDPFPPPLAKRLQLVCRSILLYSRWFDIHDGALPKVFLLAFKDAAAAAGSCDSGPECG